MMAEFQTVKIIDGSDDGCLDVKIRNDNPIEVVTPTSWDYAFMLPNGSTIVRSFEAATSDFTEYCKYLSAAYVSSIRSTLSTTEPTLVHIGVASLNHNQAIYQSYASQYAPESSGGTTQWRHIFTANDTMIVGL